MNSASVRLVLAFDASCGACRRISDTVAQACGGKLEVLPLNHPEVRGWRERWFGQSAPWAPTLIKVGGDDLRVWTGRGMVAPLVRGLGPGSTMRVLRALGELRDQRRAPAQPGALGRKRFLQIAAGAAVAAGLVFRGRTPASAETVGAWVEANRGQLPQRYDQVAALPLEYRRAVFAESSTQVRAQLWLDHLDRYRATHPDLAKGQAEVIDRARALVPTTFADGRDAVSAELTTLKDDAIAAFGQDEAGALLATLGPAEARTTSVAQADCECSNADPFCSWFAECTNWPIGCNVGSGCGTLWTRTCDGICQYPPLK